MPKKQEKRIIRHKRIRAKAFGTARRPRLCVFRSVKHIYAQLIDDEKGVTLIGASDLELKSKKKRKKKSIPPKTEGESKKEMISGRVAVAYEVGKLIAKKALEKKIEKVIFDRGGYKYHGRVKALSEGAREGGLKF